MLVLLFVLTGAQMGLSLVADYGRGVVLGDEDEHSSNKGNKNNWSGSSFEGSSYNQPTAMPTETPVILVTEAPTVIVTIEPTLTVAPTEEATVAPTPTSPTATEEQPPTSSTATQESTVTTTLQVNTIDRSTGETVRQIIKKFTPKAVPTPTPTAAPVKVEKVIPEKTANEILSILAAGQSEGEGGTVPEERLRYQVSAKGLVFVGETATGQRRNLSASESETIRQQLERSTALAVEKKDGGSVFTKGQTWALTELPLLIDLKTSSLTTETSTGIKAVAILPDEAIKSALASEAIDGVIPKAGKAEIEMKEAENGRLVYQVEGITKRKILGLIGVTLNETVLVDIQTGRLSVPEKELGRLLYELIALPQ